MTSSGKNRKPARGGQGRRPAPRQSAVAPSKPFWDKRQRRPVPSDEDKRQEVEPSLPERKVWRAGTVLAPVPAVLVSCGGAQGYGPNLVTLAWAGTVNSEPPMLSVSIRPSRYSHEIISKTREFVVNLTTASLARATDWCGVRSGRDVDKFAACHLTAIPSTKVTAPTVAESPLSLECRVKDIIPLGSHDMFLADILAVTVREELLDKKGKFQLAKSGLLVYAHGEYFLLGRRLGSFGYSVKKK